MSGAHEPREEFVDELEHQLRADLRRRALAAGTGSWMPQSRVAAALTICRSRDCVHGPGRRGGRGGV